jgi:hypothetical protein
MAEAGAVLVDGKRVTIHYQTGQVTSTRKLGETRSDSNGQHHGNQAARSTSSSAMDHHELLIVDTFAREHAFDIVDIDFAVREGHTVSVVWIVPEGAEVGPCVQAVNHDTGDNTFIATSRLRPLFFKKALMWVATIGGMIVGFAYFWPLGLAMMVAPYLYFKSRATRAINAIFASREYAQLETQLLQVKPVAAAAAA